MSYRIAAAALLALVFALAVPVSADKTNDTAKIDRKALHRDPAYRKGYDDGYRMGNNAAQANSSAYNDEDGPLFDQADDGYTAEYGDRAKYQKVFRLGYVAGYKAGWDSSAGRYAPFGPGK